MAYIIKFSDPSVSSGKLSFPIPEYKSDGPAAPLSTALQGGQFGSSTAHTSLLLVGKGVPDYGSIVQENLIYLLENFASNGTPPVFPTIGQTWFNNQDSSGTYRNYTLHVCTNEVTKTWEGLLKLTGGTMSGRLTLSADPVTPHHAATKSYVDNNLALYLPLSGGVMTGSLYLNGTPTNPNEAATKDYVDSELLTGISNHATNFDLHLTSAENAWLDNITASATEVNRLVGVTSSVQTQLNQKVNRAGDDMTGMLLLPSTAPTDPRHATTKNYVDNLVSGYVPLSGNVIMTGTFQIPPGVPPGPNYVASKSYVDLVAGSIGGSDGVVVSGSIDSATGILTLNRSIGGDIYISNIASFNHAHSTGTISHTVSNTGTLLDTTYGVGSSILLNNVVDLFDSDKADVTYVDLMTSVQRSLVTSTGQTVFTTPPYTIGSHKLWIFVNGIKAYLGDSYDETTTTSVTFTYTVPVGTKVEILVLGA